MIFNIALFYAFCSGWKSVVDIQPKGKCCKGAESWGFKKRTYSSTDPIERGEK